MLANFDDNAKMWTLHNASFLNRTLVSKKVLSIFRDTNPGLGMVPQAAFSIWFPYPPQLRNLTLGTASNSLQYAQDLTKMYHAQTDLHPLLAQHA